MHGKHTTECEEKVQSTCPVASQARIFILKRRRVYLINLVVAEVVWNYNDGGALCPFLESIFSTITSG